MVLDEQNSEKSHGKAITALQPTYDDLKESKKACQAFNSCHRVSR